MLLDEAQANGRAQFEGWSVGKDEDRFWASVIVKVIKDEEDKIMGYLQITRDLSERIAAERTIHDYEYDLHDIALKSHELRNIYQIFIAEVEGYAIIMLDENGMIVDWNPGSEKMKGYTQDEITGKHLSIFYLPEDRNKMLPESLLLKARKAGKAEHEGCRVKKDGSIFWAHITFIAIYDKKGAVQNFVKITKDMTPWVMKEKELKERIAALEQEVASLKQNRI